MKQPVPTVNHADVERIVRRDFPADLGRAVLAVLSGYDSKSAAGPYRVQLAVLKLAAGSFDALGHLVELAKIDYRDVLSAAEYPGYSRQGFNTSLMSSEEVRLTIDQDWKQYMSWLAD
jgi:hypothetical protein